MNRLGVIFISVFALLIVLNGIVRGSSGVMDYFKLIQSRDAMARAVNDLELENEALSDEITKLKTSKSYARKVLREKYHVTDENEHIVFFAE